MSEENGVVWSEGLFLRPQHFQQQDRHTEALLRAVIRALPRQAFGFLSLRLDRTALAAGQVALVAAEGLFPDGTAFSLPERMAPPAALTLSRDRAEGLIHLAIPARVAGSASVDPAHAETSGARHRGRLLSLRDTIRGGADPAEVEVAELCARLLPPGDAGAGHVLLPVARVAGLDAHGAVQLVEGHLAPALTIGALPFYATLLREIATGLDRIATAHVGMVLGGTGRSVENLLILELANAARPRLQHLLAQDMAHPSELFEGLAELAGRMATYGSSSRRLGDLPAYDHADPQPAFTALADVLRSLILSLSHVEPKSRALPVARHAQNIWKVRVDNPEILRSSRIVLRIGSDMSEASLRRIFVDQATVGAAGVFETLWKSRLPGIPLRPLHSQPREIPYDGDRLCLELDRQSEHWAQLLDAPGFVVGVSGTLEREPQIDCYAVNR